MKRIVLALLTVALGVGLTAGVGSPAQAKVQPAAKARTGYTQVVVAPSVYQLAQGAGITIAPVKGAKAKPFGRTVAARFPITGYSLENVRIRHSGGVKLSAGSKQITVRALNVDLGRLRVSGKVSGTIGNAGRVDVFKIRESKRPRYGLVRLTLTKTGADALNATFGVTAFKENATFGYASPKPFARF